MRLFLIVLAALSGAWSAAAKPELLDRIVAVVDNQVILWSELNFRLALTLEQQGRQSYISPEDLSHLRTQTLDAMVDEQVLILKAKKDSIAIEESQVEELLGEQFRRIKNRMEPDEFDQMLSRSGLTERQLKARYRKDIRHSLLFEQMRNQLAYQLHIGYRDVETFRQVHSDTLPPRLYISQINIKVKPAEEVLGEIRAKIEGIQQQLGAGEDFGDVARRYSEDPGTAASGGDLGCFKPGELLPEFEVTAIDLKPGQISDPVLTPHGYHLILLREKREDELCASHILVRSSTDQNDLEQARLQLQQLRQRAIEGEDFAQLAQEYSEDPLTAKHGGLWQSLAKDQIPPFLQPYITNLKLGGVSEPFFLDDGGHILKINDDQATLENLVREARLSESMRQTIEDFKKQIHVEMRLNEDFLWQSSDDTS